MKKIALVGLLSIGLILLVGCQSLPCLEKNGKCCRGDVCSDGESLCVEGYQSDFKGCDEKCAPIYTCTPLEECRETPQGCCKGDLCHQGEIMCAPGAVSKSLGCDENCMEQLTCEKA